MSALPRKIVTDYAVQGLTLQMDTSSHVQTKAKIMNRDAEEFALDHEKLTKPRFGRGSAFRKLSLAGISISLVFTAIFLLGGNILPALGLPRPTSMLEHAGGVHLSIVKLQGHVPLPMHAGHTRYWLGPISGLTYTTNCMTPGVLKVGYYKSQQLVGELRPPLILISAFENEDVYDRNPQPLMADAETVVMNAHGDALSYHASSMLTMTIRQMFSSEVITITYATPTTAEIMMSDSEKLFAL